jgi:hypothetical protein
MSHSVTPFSSLELCATTHAFPPGISPPLTVSLPILEPILEQLQRERTEITAPLQPSNWPAVEPCSVQEGLRTSSLGCHASWYRENLNHCSEPMLQYEWAWMNGRIVTLGHCRAGEGGELACPPEPRLEEMLSESQLFRTLLLQEFASRGLRPLPPRAAVVPSEEAWEITSASVRQEWGIEP